MSPSLTRRLLRAIPCSLAVPLVAACGAAPSPLEPIDAPPSSAVTPVAAGPSATVSSSPSAAPSPPSPPPGPRRQLRLGSPFYGPYELERIVSHGGQVEFESGLKNCAHITNCVQHRRTFTFEGRTLRIRLVTASVTSKKGEHDGTKKVAGAGSAESITDGCDAEARVDVEWQGDAMILATTVVASARNDQWSRKQKPTRPGAYDLDWTHDFLTCSATTKAGTYRVKNVSAKMDGNRPAGLVLETAEATYELSATVEDRDIKPAINQFFGQH